MLTHMSWNKKWTDIIIIIIIHAQFSRDLKTSNWFEVFETKNYKRTNSDRRNIDLSSIFKMCVSLTHLKPVFLFISLIFWRLGLFNHYVALLWVGGWGVGEITFVQKCYGKRRAGEFLFCFTISDPVHFEVNWVSISSSVYMWASLIAVLQENRRVSKSQGSKILVFLNLFKKLFQLTHTLTFDFTVTIISNSSVCNNFYDGRFRF